MDPKTDWVLRRAEGGILIFFCPGCRGMHSVWTEGPTTWSWNGDMVKPTFNPSILITRQEWTPPVTPDNMAQWRLKPWPQTQVEKRCHTFVKDGMIQFLGDCTHALAGKTVPLPKDPLSHLGTKFTLAS